MTDRPDIPMGYTYDTHGNVLTSRDGESWSECTRDAAGNIMAYRTGRCRDGHTCDANSDSTTPTPDEQPMSNYSSVPLSDVHTFTSIAPRVAPCIVRFSPSDRIHVTADDFAMLVRHGYLPVFTGHIPVLVIAPDDGADVTEVRT